MNSLLSDRGTLSPDAVTELRKHTDMLDCECPHHLLNILEAVRNFESYTQNCIERFPKDAGTHQWLLQAAINIDSMLSTTIVQLARIEGFVDDENKLVDRTV